jgi:Ca2+-binding EF-hand superfamily protein
MNKILKKNVLPITISVSLMSIFSLSALAQPHRGAGPEGSQKNQQGELNAASILNRMDDNADGIVTLDDFIDHALKRTDRDFERLDSDGDSLISAAEFATRPAHQQNNSIDHDALKLCVEESTGITLNERPSTEDTFLSADIDNDGYLSSDELVDNRAAHVAERFAELDSDDDGIISEAEITAKMTERQLLDSAHQTCINEQLLLDNSATNI